MVRITKVLEVLKEDGNALTVKHNDEEIIFDFEDHSPEENHSLSSGKVYVEEGEFVFDEEADKEAEEEENVPLEIKLESEENMKPNIDANAFKTISGTWKCNLCEKETKNRGHMLNHVGKHIPGLYACSMCEKSYDTRRKLRSHLKKTHDVNQRISPKIDISKDLVKCDQCDYEAFTNTRMNLHKKVKHNDQDYACILCDYVSKSFYGFRDHKRTQHGESLQCDQCNYTAKRKRILNVHKLSKHSKEADYLYCDLCSFKTPVKRHLDRHALINHTSDPLLCEYCEFKTVIEKKLNEHVKVQHEGFMYECVNCDYKGTSAFSFRKHKDVVHKGKMFLCDKCEFKSTERSHLKRHVSVKHEGKKYLCESCEYQATRPDRLQQHIRVAHEGIVHQCNLCQSKFRRKDKINRHMRNKHSDDTVGNFTIITDKNPTSHIEYQAVKNDGLSRNMGVPNEGLVYKCNLCDTKIRRKDKMHKHQREKHSNGTLDNFSTIIDKDPSQCTECGKVHRMVEKHFNCKSCTEKFSQERGLKSHMIRKHKVISKDEPQYEESNPLHCHTCKKVIKSETYLMYHMDTQHVFKSEYYDCRFCDYKVKVKFPHSLLEHLRTHTGERPEKCDICGQCFKTKKTLTNHHKTHTKNQLSVSIV